MTTTHDEQPEVLDIPIGLDATGMRQEFDSLGEVKVPADHQSRVTRRCLGLWAGQPTGWAVRAGAQAASAAEPPCMSRSWANPAAAVHELRRVTSPGGR